MKIDLNPLAEVFGFPVSNNDTEANRYRRNRLCPFNNKVPSCTKDKINDPLGVCSIFAAEQAVATCPIRFREKWIIVEDAAKFFFNGETLWTSLTEVRLNDKQGGIAGIIDLVLVSYDTRGRILDFGSLEVQAVYISGNIRRPFEEYMSSFESNIGFSWTGINYPRADYLSSSRKRLVPQMLYKGGILKAWDKKQAVALQAAFFKTLPALRIVPKEKADIAWLLYDLEFNEDTKVFNLVQKDVVHTEFGSALHQITTADPGKVDNFIKLLQDKLDEKLNGSPPDVSTSGEVTLG